MSAALAWISENGWAWVVAFFALVAIVNRLTIRWDEYTGPAWRRFLLLLTEVGSIVTSKEYRGVFGVLKLPGNPYGGKPTRIPFPKPPGAVLWLLIGGLALPAADGCSQGWSTQASKSIAAAHEMAKGGWTTARAVLAIRCQQALDTCSTDADLTECGPYQLCAQVRRNHATAFAGVQEMIALAQEALNRYERLAAKQGEAAASLPGSDLAKLQGQVQERTDRAQRAAIDLVRELRAEGLIDGDD